MDEIVTVSGGKLTVDPVPLDLARTRLERALRQEFDIGGRADTLVQAMEALVKAKVNQMLAEREIAKFGAR
jgi:hypothetical protein